MSGHQNLLLHAFGDEARALLGSLVPVQLKARETLQEPGMPVLHVYFPVDTVISVIAVLETGATVEVSLVGREGMVGMAGVLGTTGGQTSAVVQVAGTAIRVPTAALRAARLVQPSVRSTLDLYFEACFLQAAQAVACSRLHPIQPRLARWLLGVHDRTRRNELRISQESIADLLGVHRPTVSTTLQRLQDEGAIVRRGRAIIITDRPRLESLACECHRIVDDEFTRLLGPRGARDAGQFTSRTDTPDATASAALEAMRDIAGRLLLTSIREQEAREQAEEALQAKGRLLAMVSHELRNPLNAILGWCAALGAQGDTHSGIEVIAQNARAQLRLVDDLLDAARMTSATLEVHKQPIVLPDVVQHAIDAVTPAADQQQVQIRLTRDDDLPPVPADADRIRQVLLNLLTNSLKSTPSGGSIDVHVSSGNRHARVTVTDTGHGIDAALLPHVFEQFRQGSTPGAGRRQGLGLGLAIARAIVELHGGTIAIHSRGANPGTTCTFELPHDSSPGGR